MSIPEEGKKTSTHQVVNVTYDTDAMRKFMILNVVLSLILMSTVIYMASVVCGQTSQIQMLSKMVNELNYKNEEQSLTKIQASNGQISILSENQEFLEHIASNLESGKQDLKKIKFQSSGLTGLVEELKKELKGAVSLINEQSKSSWEMKEIIEGIKRKLEFLSKMIEDIPKLFQNIVNPDFGSMKEKIKGTFSSIKDSVGSVFYADDDQENKEGNKKDEGMFDGMRDRFQRGWRAYTRPSQNQKQL